MIIIRMINLRIDINKIVIVNMMKLRKNEIHIEMIDIHQIDIREEMIGIMKNMDNLTKKIEEKDINKKIEEKDIEMAEIVNKEKMDIEMR